MISVRAASPQNLQRLYAEHEWFKLIAAVHQRRAPLFFRGAVDCALDNTESCIREMSEIVNAGKSENEVYEAHSLLAGLYIRKAEYARSLAETELLLKIRPNDSDALGSIPFLKAASTLPRQKVSSKAASHVPWTDPTRSLTIPVMVNGKRAKYFIDTGANVSTLSDADAQRLGLEVHQATVKANGASGASATFRVASAKHVRIGNFELENVVFLVFPANQPPFIDKPALEQGIIGLPILIAAKHVSLSRRGFDIVGDRAKEVSPTPNLAMDGGYATANSAFQTHPLTFLLDSGSISTFMYPRFTQEYMNYIQAHGTKVTKQLQGFGGQANVAAWRLAKLRVKIGATTESLHQIDALLDHTDQNSHNYDGCLGLDTMLNRNVVDLNFETMEINIR